MLIQGSCKSDRTNLLIQKYTDLLNCGIEANKILVLVQNSYKKNQFITEVKKLLKIQHYEEPQIHTFYGLIYNTILNFWPIIQDTINIGENVVTPNLTGLEISQFFFRQAVKEAGFSDYNSKINLIHQMFRRYSLIVNNALSEQDVEKRSQILKEVFATDAKSAIENYKKKTLEYRTFDYIRQAAVFSYIYKKHNCFKDIQYLIIDDADEITTLELDFIKSIKPQLKEPIIGYDKYGSSRIGFLNTDTQAVKEIEKTFSNEETVNLDNIDNFTPQVEHNDCSRRLEMLNKTAEKISELIKKGISPDEISIITPTIDTTLKFTFEEAFLPQNIKISYYSGSEKLKDTPLVKNILTVLNISLGVETDVFSVRSVLNNMLKIPVKYCMPVIVKYKETGSIQATEFENPIYTEAIKSLKGTIDQITNDQITLSQKTFEIYKNLVNPNFDEFYQLEKVNFFIKQIQDFENVFHNQKCNQALQKAILNQLENSIISENPAFAPEIEEKSIIVATAQKIIDFSLKTKYQFWLDISSSEWTKEDMGTLYNAWVFQKSWNKEEFTYEDSIELAKLKTKKQLRKLSLLAQDKIYAYSSLFDTEGNENFGGIEEYILPKEKQTKDFDFKFTPRDDQKPVLEYKSGNMAISAVPGAGKTTILLALIIKLLSDGVQSDNIFVMTYMDSAAKNFKERIKKACPNLEKMPNISTIHGLALRILKENSNYLRVGLNADFEVCDDNLRQKIIREIMSKLQIDQNEFDRYDKAISALKLSDIKEIPYVKDKEIFLFIKFYNAYNNYLKSRNIIDYDDMLSYCVKILEENKDIAEYYQDICHYVIEDEAQDSSVIQQKLLSLLCKKHKNLIRCGDINQAITTTFTNADLEGFKTFISNSNNVSMNRSQRCSKDVYQTANKLIDFSKTNENLKNSFFDIKMNEVTGKNPVVTNGLNVQTFDNYTEENSYILEQIRHIFNKDPKASIAILVRNNYIIEEYSQFLGQYGYNVITKSDCLKNQPVFALILALLKFCSHPWNNETVLNVAETIKQQKILKITNEDLQFIKDLKKPFILQKADETESSQLSQLLWDLNYWLENTHLTIEETVVKMGNYYYNTDVEKSNIYIIATLLKRMEIQYKTHDILLERIEELSQRPILSKFKFFTDTEEKSDLKESSIQIMTYHKSKGDEFDYVFIPGLSEEILPIDLNQIKIKSKERFIEAVKSLNLKYKKKDEQELKQFIAQENLRLFYVAITRAKKKLYISCAKKYKKYSRLKDTKISLLFDNMLLGEKNANK